MSDTDKDHERAPPVVENDDDKSPGVRRIEAIVSILTRTDMVILYIGLILASYARSLASYLDTPFHAAAIAGWGQAGQAATLGVVRATIGAASQPIWAKIMDNLGRPTTYYMGTLFYVLGYIVQAAAPNFGALCGGLVLNIFGFGAHNIFLYVIGADTTTLRWRMLSMTISALPGIINVWAVGIIAQKVVVGPGWRWGFGIGAIVLPVITVPLFLILIWKSWQAKRRGLFAGTPGAVEQIVSPRFWRDMFWRADIPGLILLAAAIALTLIPLTLGGGVASEWRTARVLAPFLTGVLVALPAFVLWERVAPHALLPVALLRQRHVLVSVLCGMLYPITDAQQSTYLYYSLVVAFGQSVDGASRIAMLGIFVFGLAYLALGFVMRWFNRPKPVALVGAAVFLLSYGLLYHYRGGHGKGDLAGLIAGEVLGGIGAALSNGAILVGLQARLGHEQLAITLAILFCAQQIGAGIGAAITGAIWTNTMPGKLAHAFVSAGQDPRGALAVYGNPLMFAFMNPPGTVLRNAVDQAYREEQRLLCISGLAFASVLLVASLALEDTELSSRQFADKEDHEQALGGGEKTENVCSPALRSTLKA